jgi:hypothetical protein
MGPSRNEPISLRSKEGFPSVRVFKFVSKRSSADVRTEDRLRDVSLRLENHGTIYPTKRRYS